MSELRSPREIIYEKKKFDAVRFQQKTRKELGEGYNFDRENFMHELNAKYGNLRIKAIYKKNRVQIRDAHKG